MAAILISTGELLTVMMEFERGWEEEFREFPTPIRFHHVGPSHTCLCFQLGLQLAFLKLLLSLARQSGSFKIETENEEMYLKLYKCN